MSDMLGIASNAIGAYQRALSTVSNNIANVNTEGYSRQDVVLKDSAPKQLANMYIGTGVMLQNIKRQYDEFAESNLRNSNSDLSAQTPMVDYTKRVMDIMGDKSIGLSSAFDNFFVAASALSADPASTVQRTSFLRSADGVASRFVELNNQLDLIATETNEGIKSVAAQVNTLTSQLALINQSLSKSPTLETQPAELLDRRDLTLRQLSELVRTKVSFTTNGTVSVSLGTTMTQGLVVNGNKARPIGVNNSAGGKMELVLDPYGNTESLASASGGQLGGYQSFISQVLDPAQKSLSALAQTFVKEANNIQGNGIDGYGQMGQNLFGFDATASTPAAGIRLALNDGMRIATAAQFRVSEGNTNITTTRATVKFTGATPQTALSNTQLVNNPNKAAGVTFKVDGANVYMPVTTLSAGVGATFYLDDAQAGQQLQVLTRDGRQLLGQALSETEKYQLLTPTNGFAANASYSDAYLNKSGEYAYRDLDLFYGAKSTVSYGQNYDQFGAKGPALPMPAVLDGARVETADFSIPAGAMQINGISLNEFTGQTATELRFSGIRLDDEPGATVFEFNALIGDRLIRQEVVANGTVASLKQGLQDALSSLGLTVKLINNEQDIVITDEKGRGISGAALTPTNPDGGATGGVVSVNSPANQLANWINGSSSAKIASPIFGLQGFSAFKANLGEVPLSVDLTEFSMGPLGRLAERLQTALREYDQSPSISVNVEGDQLNITDALGRTFKDTKLVAKQAGDAVTGTVTLQNSILSQTHVRAEVVSELRVPVKSIDFDKPLTLNGQAITGFSSVDSLVKAINDSSAGLVASVAPDGQLVIENPLGGEIRVGSSLKGNAINVMPGTYNAQLRMVQVVRDMRVGSADINFASPLTINGVNFSEANYTVGTSSASYKVEFGYPAKSVSATTPEALASAINHSATVSDIKWPATGYTMDMTVSVNVTPVSLSWDPDSYVNDPAKTTEENNQAKLEAMALDYQTQLSTHNIRVSAQSGSLVFSNLENATFEVNQFQASKTGSVPLQILPAGVIDKPFAQLYYAATSSGQFTIGSVRGDIPENDIKNSFVISTDSGEVYPATGVKTLQGLVDRINAQQDKTRVAASIDENGDLKLTTTDAKGTGVISIGPGKSADGSFVPNTFGLEPQDYGVSKRLESLLVEKPYMKDIRVSFGAYQVMAQDGTSSTHYGDPAMLSQLGLRTAAYIEGGCPDDLQVFVTGKGSAKVAVRFDGEPDNVRDSLRTQALKVMFTAEDRYNIVDVKTGTVLADRYYDPTVLEPVVEYNGLQIKLSHAPAMGDSYTIDGNFDGLGNNLNMLDMVELSKKPTENGKTIGNTYIDQINNVGNLAQQAIITQEALQVVNDQAVASRDKVSGVNLDDEAAALIRYQQAYQACAKAVQVSGELFDAIVAIR
jgi:flagellar hook-associated protein FlgK